MPQLVQNRAFVAIGAPHFVHRLPLNAEAGCVYVVLGAGVGVTGAAGADCATGVGVGEGVLFCMVI